MLVANLIGGLGNQMFQYAAARALALRHGVPLLLDTTDFVRFPPRRYLLDQFEVDAPIASAADVARFDKHGKHWRATARRLLGRWSGSRHPVTIFEHGFPWQRIPFDPAVDTCLVGYWQSERYFIDVAPVIRRDFTLRSPPGPQAQRLLDEIDGAAAVSLHVRRGDYVSDPGVQARHGLMGPEYYAAAVARMLTLEPAARFYVFSDDLDWVRTGLPIDAPVEYVDLNGPDLPQEDLRLMSRCRHHIIANSSLSWWGAWLNPRPGKVVIAPRQWFTPRSRRDARDIVPAEWLRL